MDDKAKIAVPLHSVHNWRISCKCGGHVDIGSGVIHAIDSARCPECKVGFNLEHILPLFKLVRKCVMSEDNEKLSMLILLDRCEEIK